MTPRSIVSLLPTRVIFRELFGISTATPLQLAICRLIDGEAVTNPGQREALTKACGGVLPASRPKELYLLAAIRSAKSMIAAATALRASQTVDLSALKHGETPRYSILSTSRDNARVIFKHLIGTIRAEPDILAPLVVKDTSDTITMLHPSGREVEIHISAGARAGSTLVARWSMGVTFDEAPRMGGEDDGVINLEDSASAVRFRLLPGAQILYVGSPWAPFGPVYKAVQSFYGKPTADICVLRAAGPAMNPVLWTPEACKAARLRDPDAYATDVLGEFRLAESGLFGSELELAIRMVPETLPADSKHQYVAAIDPGTRGNAWTLVIVTREGQKRRVVQTHEWKGTKSEPLNPSRIFSEIAMLVRPYRIKELTSDQWSYDALRDTASQHGIHLRQRALTMSEQADGWISLRNDMIQGNVEVAGAQLVDDLKHLMKRTTQAAFMIHLPETADGRHCDFAPALLRAYLTYCPDWNNPPSAADQERARIDDMRRRQETPPVPVRKRV